MKVKIPAIDLSDVERVAIAYTRNGTKKADREACVKFMLAAITEALDEAVGAIPRRKDRRTT